MVKTTRAVIAASFLLGCPSVEPSAADNERAIDDPAIDYPAIDDDDSSADPVGDDDDSSVEPVGDDDDSSVGPVGDDDDSTEPTGDEHATPGPGDLDGDGVPDAADCDPTDPTVGGSDAVLNLFANEPTWSIELHDRSRGVLIWTAADVAQATGALSSTVPFGTYHLMLTCSTWPNAACPPYTLALTVDGALELSDADIPWVTNSLSMAFQVNDADDDGTPACLDCDDLNPAVFPGAPEVCNGIDDDCDGQLPAEELDVDGDGALACDDCSDTDAAVITATSEVCNGIDDDCDGQLAVEELDVDGDGALGCADCNDNDATVITSSPEVCDGIDNDCDGQIPADEVDVDGDGARLCVDCNDNDPALIVGTPEVCDGVDTDCDYLLPPEELDVDADGVLACDDCDDTDPAAWPGAPEVCDGDLEDCDGLIDDADGDGSRICGPDPDCDDTEPSVWAGAAEVCDGLDNDCDPATVATAFGDDVDADGDGVADCVGVVSPLLERALALAFDDEGEDWINTVHGAVLQGSEVACPSVSTGAGGPTPHFGEPTDSTTHTGGCTAAQGVFAGSLGRVQEVAAGLPLTCGLTASEDYLVLDGAGFSGPQASWSGTASSHDWSCDDGGAGFTSDQSEFSVARQGTLVFDGVGVAPPGVVAGTTVLDLILSGDSASTGSVGDVWGGSSESLIGTASQVAADGSWSLSSTLQWWLNWDSFAPYPWYEPGCGLEPWSGSLTVTGTLPDPSVAPFTAVLTFEAPCDGCGTLTVDGADFGPYCL